MMKERRNSIKTGRRRAETIERAAGKFPISIKEPEPHDTQVTKLAYRLALRQKHCGQYFPPLRVADGSLLPIPVLPQHGTVALPGQLQFDKDLELSALVQSVLVVRNSLFGIQQSKKRIAKTTVKRTSNANVSPLASTSAMPSTPAETTPKHRRARIHSTIRSATSEWCISGVCIKKYFAVLWLRESACPAVIVVVQRN